MLKDGAQNTPGTRKSG